MSCAATNLFVIVFPVLPMNCRASDAAADELHSLRAQHLRGTAFAFESPLRGGDMWRSLRPLRAHVSFFLIELTDFDQFGRPAECAPPEAGCPRPPVVQIGSSAEAVWLTNIERFKRALAGVGTA